MNSQTDEVFVSIVIPTYGRPDRAVRIVEQLLGQEADWPYEILVIDDGSPEPLAPLIEKIGNRRGVELRCLRKPNGGPASARNFGAKHARGRYLLFVDDDMSVQTDFMRHHLETHERFGPCLVNAGIEWKLEPGPEPFHTWFEARVNQWMDTQAQAVSRLDDRVFRAPDGLTMSCNLSLLKSDFERLNGLDEGYSAGACEDQDLGARAAYTGIPTLVIRKSPAVHLDTSNSIRKLCRRQQRGASDTVRLVRKLAVTERFGVPSIARAGDPIRFSDDPPGLVAKKLLRRALVSKPLSAVAFTGIELLERVPGTTALVTWAYDVMIGAYIQAGWREGLQVHAAVEPLEGLPSAKAT